MLRLLSFLFIIALVLVIRGVKIVPQETCFVIERLGKYYTSWDAGLHILLPIDKVAKKVSLKEQVADFLPQDVITKDNVTMQIDTVVYYKVFDPCLYTYGVQRPIAALENLTATTLRNIVGDLELDETLTSRDRVNSEMKQVIDEATDAWGLRIRRCEVKNIVPPQEIRTAMEKQMKAEREKRQTILEAEAHKQAAVLRAQGDREATVIHAEAEKEAKIAKAQAEAEAIRLVYEAEANGLKILKEANMDENVLTVKKLEALKALGDGRATKIILPTELTESASKLNYTAEMLNLGEPIDKNPKTIKAPVKKDVCCDEPEVRTVETKKMVQEPVASPAPEGKTDDSDLKTLENFKKKFLTKKGNDDE